MWVGGQRHASDAVPILQEAGWSPRPVLPGFDPRTVQPVASRYTDYAIPARTLYAMLLQIETSIFAIFLDFRILYLVLKIKLKTQFT